MADEGLKPFNSSPFFRITDFAVPVKGLVIGLLEEDDTEDLAYLYRADGTFVESRPGVPRDNPLGHFNHTMFTKVGAHIYSVDGGQSNYDAYKNGVGFIAGSGSANYITNQGKTLWIQKNSNSVALIASYDSTTGAQLSTKQITWPVTRHRTNGTHHVYTQFRANTFDPDWRFRHCLAGSDWIGEIVLMERTEINGSPSQTEFLDVAINTDRVAVVDMNYNAPATSTIKIFDLSGTLKDTLTNPGQAEMLLMNDDKLYCSDAITGVVTMWDITAVFGDKVYTPAGSFSTPAPFVWYGN